MGTGADVGAAERAFIPVGVVTILFSDLEGFTRYAEQHGDDAARELAEKHHELLRQQLARYGGREVKTLGDGLMAAFASARQAVLCAVAAQRSFRAYAESQGLPLRARMGLDAGEPLIDPETGDLIGQAVNRTSRVADQAPAGGILVSETVKGLVGHLEGIRFEDRGLKALKGLPERVRLYEVLPAEALDPERSAAELRRWLGEPQARPVVHLPVFRLLGTGLRLLLRRGRRGIGIPFLIVLALYLIPTTPSSDLEEGRVLWERRVSQEKPLPPGQSGEEQQTISIRIGPPPFNGVQVLLGVLSFLMTPLLIGLTVRMVLNAVEGQPLLTREELSTTVRKHYLPLLEATGAYFAGIVMVTFGIALTLILFAESFLVLRISFYLLVFGTLYVMVRWAFFAPIVVGEGRRVLEALRQSWRATRHHSLRLLGLTLLTMLPLVVPLALIQSFLGLRFQESPEGPWQSLWQLPPSEALARWWEHLRTYGLSLDIGFDPWIVLINPWFWSVMTLAYLRIREGSLRLSIGRSSR